jgi:hypothetical protein
LCAYFNQAPASTKWQVYNVAGQLVSEAGFGSPYDQCLNTASLAPGVYIVRMDRMEADGSENVVTQKVAIVEAP